MKSNYLHIPSIAKGENLNVSKQTHQLEEIINILWIIRKWMMKTNKLLTSAQLWGIFQW